MVKAKVFKTTSKKEVNAASASAGVVCFHCKETGHYSKACLKKPAFKCFTCGEEGHGARACLKGVAGRASESKDKGKEATMQVKKAKADKKSKKEKKVKCSKWHVINSDE